MQTTIYYYTTTVAGKLVTEVFATSLQRNTSLLQDWVAVGAAATGCGTDSIDIQQLYEANKLACPTMPNYTWGENLVDVDPKLVTGPELSQIAQDYCDSVTSVTKQFCLNCIEQLKAYGWTVSYNGYMGGRTPKGIYMQASYAGVSFSIDFSDSGKHICTYKLGKRRSAKSIAKFTSIVKTLIATYPRLKTESEDTINSKT